MWRLENPPPRPTSQKKNPHMYLAILRFLFSQIAKFSQKKTVNLVESDEEPHDENILSSDAECEIPVVYFCVRTRARTYFPHLRLRRYALPPVYFCVRTYVHNARSL